MKQQMLFSDLHVHDSLFKCEASLIKLLLLIVKEESHNMLSWFCHTSTYVITSDSCSDKESTEILHVFTFFHD